MFSRFSKQFFILALSLLMSFFIIHNAELINTQLSIELQAEAIRVIICLTLLFLIESIKDQQQIYLPLFIGVCALYFGNLLNLIDDFYDMNQAPLATIEDLFATIGLISVLIGVGSWAKYHKNQIKHLMKLAATDPLTGLLNRRAAMSQISKYKVTGLMDCVMILDLDNFKVINDTFGHSAGDNVLKEVANILLNQLTNNEIIARWGGEEFLIYCKQPNEEACLELAIKIKYQVSQHLFKANDTSLKVTTSIGVATSASEKLKLSETIKRADKALYQAKAAGRDYVQMAGVNP